MAQRHSTTTSQTTRVSADCSFTWEQERQITVSRDEGAKTLPLTFSVKSVNVSSQLSSTSPTTTAADNTGICRSSYQRDPHPTLALHHTAPARMRCGCNEISTGRPDGTYWKRQSTASRRRSTD